MYRVSLLLPHGDYQITYFDSFQFFIIKENIAYVHNIK
jgi:hypothetical protein